MTRGRLDDMSTLIEVRTKGSAHLIHTLILIFMTFILVQDLVAENIKQFGFLFKAVKYDDISG